MNRERMIMGTIWALAALGCVLGLAAPISDGAQSGLGEQVLAIVRVIATAALTVTLLLGPGIIWRAAGGRRTGLAFIPLPGLAILVITGGLAWLLAGSVGPRVVSFALLGPVLGLLLGALLGAGPEKMLDSEEQRTLLIIGCALGLAIGRALWSLGPEGELYSGGISRTLEVGDRPDSRISYIIPQLVAHGSNPYGRASTSFYAPYNFSSRGPLAGMASAPLVLMSGAHPPLELPELPWRPFDPEGFMAYRLAMMTFACTAFISLWDLVRRLGGLGAARFALLLGVTTPFLLHEVWFTWPKLLAASFVLLAGICILDRRALYGGLLLGVAYLMHPSGLLGLAALGLLALWPLRDANWRRPDIKALLLLITGLAVSLIAWRLVNGSHYSQNGFIEYTTEAGFNLDPSLGTWLGYRLASAGNTLIPLALPIFSAHNSSINVVGGISPAAVHFFFEYWDSVPFGLAIVFFPFLLVSLWRAWRLWRWPVAAVVVIPFLAFTVYWGASDTGMLREGLQAWVLGLVAMVAMQQRREGFPWLGSRLVRTVLVLRVAEVLIVAIGPTLVTTHALIGPTYTLIDVAAVVAVVGFSAVLAWRVWKTTPAVLGALTDGRGNAKPRIASTPDLS